MSPTSCTRRATRALTLRRARCFARTCARPRRSTRYSDCERACPCAIAIGIRSLSPAPPSPSGSSPMVPIRPTSMLRRAVILLLLALALPCAAQPRFGLSAEAFAVYQRWVLAMCLGTDAGQMRADLLRHATELAPAFRRAISEGPTAAEAQQVRAAAQALFDQRRKSPINELEITGVTRADVA